mgnify:CR=1 FL=1
MSADAAFTITSVYVNIFSDRTKTISYDKDNEYMSATNGEGDRPTERIIFLVHLLKLDSDTATSKTIAIIKL